MKKENKRPKDENGDRHGYWEIYHHNSILGSKGYWVHGFKYGYFEEYYTNGQLCYKANYIHGKKCGLWVWYNNNNNNNKRELQDEWIYFNENIIYRTSKNKLIL